MIQPDRSALSQTTLLPALCSATFSQPQLPILIVESTARAAGEVHQGEKVVEGKEGAP